jgi:hypothetical protein
MTSSEEHRLGVSENRVLRRIFGPKMDDIIGGWRKQRNEELCNLYSLTHNIGMHGGEEECLTGFWWASQNERDHQEDIGRRLILKRILEKQDGVVWTGLMWLRRALVSTVMNLRVPYNVREFLSS